MADARGKHERPIIIVKKTKKGGGGHHGGAWKVAYADFVTAMMAFFLVMWLVTAVSKEQRAAIFDYFKNPSMEPGKSTKPAPGQMGPGGASTSPINLGGGLDAPRTTTRDKPGIGTPVTLVNREKPNDVNLTPEQRKVAEEKIRAELATAKEKERLESLMKDLREALSKSQALEPFKDQLLLDITPEGLRIQIVDAQNRPMFDLGGSRLKSYTNDILRELTPYLNSVPNHISLTGHTDTSAYAGITGYTNWDLSTDRANAARRALEQAGLNSDKVARVVGLSSSVLFDKQNPKAPINRRISIIVMTHDAEQEALKTEVPAVASTAAQPDANAALAATTNAAGPATAAPPGASATAAPPAAAAAATPSPAALSATAHSGAAPSAAPPAATGHSPAAPSAAAPAATVHSGAATLAAPPAATAHSPAAPSATAPAATAHSGAAPAATAHSSAAPPAATPAAGAHATAAATTSAAPAAAASTTPKAAAPGAAAAATTIPKAGAPAPKDAVAAARAALASGAPRGTAERRP
jgi:chemotaxis protein MotB